MRHVLLFVFLAAALMSCGGTVGLPTNDTSLQDELRNPLYAEYYYDDLTNTLVELALHEDPILEEPGVQAIVDRTRLRSLEHANLATKAQDKGLMGRFIGDRSLVGGDALLLDDVLYIGPTFSSAPGPSLTMYLTSIIDPRDVTFPDDTAISLGSVKDQYGAQSFAVPPQPEWSGSGARLRTAVLWDDDLKLLYGFAQLATPIR